MSNIAYGMDFGTSNSSVAVLESEGPRVLPIGEDGSSTVPSVIFFPDNRQEGDAKIGYEAISAYVTSGMKGRLLQSIKSFVPHPSFTGTVIIGHGHFKIEALLAKIMIALKTKADAIVGQNVKKVVLGKPAFFSHNLEDDQLAEQRMRDAAKLAGFSDVAFQQEPVAAAYFYEASMDKPGLVFVADLGGGTSDFTLIELSPDGSRSLERKILAVDNVYVGGDDFDSEIMRCKLLPYFGSGAHYHDGSKMLPMPRSMMHNICQWRTIPLLRNQKIQEFIRRLLVVSDDKEAIERLQSLINDNLGYALFKAIEKAKCQISSEESAMIEFAHDEMIGISEEITRSQFSMMADPELSRIDECIDEMIRGTGISPDKIDAIFLTGGTSQIPAIHELLREKFGEERLQTGDTFLSVATGLALSSKFFFS